MMPEAIVEEFVLELKRQLPQLQQQLLEQRDLPTLEKQLMERLKQLYGQLIEHLVQTWLSSAEVQQMLRGLGGQLARRHKEQRKVRVQIGWGVEIELWAGYFLKAGSKSRTGCAGRPKGSRGSGHNAYLGLEVLGIFSRCSVQWLGEVVELALLCPSLEVARQVLARRGVEMDIKRLRRLCREVGRWCMNQRGRSSWKAQESWSGYTVVIAVDGGRVRLRRPKRGRRPQNQARQGYHGDWREPKLLVMYVLNEKGDIVSQIEPIYDATMGNHEGVFWLLEQYLKPIECSSLARVVFCGDGAPWIWNQVEKLCERYELPSERIHQVLDYTHAKQNLQDLIDCLPKRVQAEGTVAQQWRSWLAEGQLERLEQDLRRQLRGKPRAKALRKWASFFAPNVQRMQYARFRQLHLPCGSGAVESAIRRVINLRLKGAGIFWSPEMIETFLFLRAQLLSGRWSILLQNLARSKARLLDSRPGHPQSCAANEADFEALAKLAKAA
jgi:hypothetical protein